MDARTCEIALAAEQRNLRSDYLQPQLSFDAQHHSHSHDHITETLTTTMLCDVCVDVFRDHRIAVAYGDMRLGLHQIFLTFEQSAIQGCYICSAIWRELSRTEKSWLRAQSANAQNESDFKMSACFLNGYGRHDLEFTVDIYANSIFTYNSFTLTEASPVDSNRSAPPASLGSDNTLSEGSLRCAKKWLHECIHCHKTCNQSTSTTSWYPTRLLYVGGLDQGQDQLRLIRTAKELPDGPYMTLSHRWGEQEFIKLTKSTLESFCQAVQIADLPKTFADAVFLSRQLGVRYLWIDSLCIMQDKDDLSDWSREAGLMHKVYSNSHANIFASVAEDSSEGLSRNRDPSTLYPTVRVNLKDLNMDTEFLDYEILEGRLWRTNVDNCHLNSRGWVFQEKMLPPRILYFSHDQLFWECREQKACERYPNSHASLRISKYDSITNFRKILIDDGPVTKPSASKPDVDSLASYYKLWAELVEDYSKTELTKPLDRLIALSGVAEVMSSVLQDTYVAGLWRNNLAPGLLWQVTPSSTDEVVPNPHPTNCCAPTWSWASVNSPVIWRYKAYPRSPFIHVVDVVLEHTTEGAMGRVANGWLDVRGQLKPITLYPNPNYKPNVRQQDSKFEERPEVHLDIPIGNSQSILSDYAKAQLYYMPVDDGSTVKFWTVVMLLLRVKDAQRGIFERVGLAVYVRSTNRRATGHSALFEELDEKDKEKLPCLQYQDGLHTIRIV